MRVSPVVSGVYCHVVLQSDVPEEVLLARAASEGCRVLSVRSFYEKSVAGTDKEFLLSFSKIPAQELTQAVAALRRAWLEKEGNQWQKDYVLYIVVTCIWAVPFTISLW